MKRLIKFSAILAAAAAALVIVLVVAIKVFLPPEKVRTLIESQMASRLHRQTKLGSVSVGLFNGLRVTGFALSEKPDFDKGTFVSSDELQVRVSLLPLLARKVVVHDVKLVKPMVRIVRFPDGKFNFSDLSGSAPDKPAPVTAKKEASDLQVIVTGVSLTGGRLAFEDQMPGGRSVTIDPLNASVKNLTLTGNADVQTSLGVKTGDVAAALDFAGGVNVVKGSVAIRKFRITSGDSAISVSGSAGDLTADPSFDVKVALEKLNLPLLAKLAPDAAAYRPTGDMSGSISLKGKQNGFTFDSALELAAAGFSVPDTFAKPAGKPMSIAAKGRLDQMSTLKLDDLSLVLGGLKTTGSGEIRAVTESTRTFSLSIKTEPFSIPDILGFLPKNTLPADVELGGNGALTARVNGTAQSSNIEFSVDASAANVAYGQSFHKPAGVPLTIQGAGHYSSPTAVHLTSLEISLAGMKLAGVADYASGAKGFWAARMKSEPFAVAPVAALAPAAGDYAPSGTATLDVDARSGTASPDVKGSFTLKDGAAKYQTSAITQIATAGSFTMDSVSVPSFKSLLNGASLAMKINAKNIDKHPDIQADIDAAELDLDKLIPKDTGPKKTDASPASPSRWAFRLVEEAQAADMMSLPMDLSGTLKVGKIHHSYFDGNNLDLVWKLTGVTMALDKISGTARLRHGKGEVRNLQKLTADSTAARILFKPLALVQKLGNATGGAVKIPSMDQFPFSSIAGDYTFRDGVMTITSFLLKASSLDASLTGTVGLPGNQPVDAKGTVTVSGIAMPFTVKGPAASATPKIDVANTVINAVKSGVADKYLKQFGLPTFGKPKTEDPAPAQPAAPGSNDASAPSQAAPANAAPAQPAQKSPQDQQIQDVQNLLKGLFKGH